MEIPIAAAAAAAEQAEPVSVQHHGQRRAAAAAAAAAPQHRRHRMLIVVGEVSTSHHLDAARKQITQGLRSWNVDLTVCGLNKELQAFETRHTAQFSAHVKALTSPTDTRSKILREDDVGIDDTEMF
ncbi:hypothetical protein F2P81_004058 [Scophthalmus maximus]|uniref:Microtubule-associated protein 1B/S N-terminal domain-containing protein n=1 Tax=Scophthalmus maximus TaxID=52904 RepID=A0A6A4TIM3_SCOMX|nr:hypothetical protein F2P81_004058 [Scophthalmus maximus]